MPKSKVTIIAEVEHHEKTSSNITVGADTKKLIDAVYESFCHGENGRARLLNITAVPIEEGVSARAAEKKDYPA